MNSVRKVSFTAYGEIAHRRSASLSRCNVLQCNVALSAQKGPLQAISALPQSASQESS